MKKIYKYMQMSVSVCFAFERLTLFPYSSLIRHRLTVNVRNFIEAYGCYADAVVYNFDII
jgi:hypothetical protein